MSETLKHFIYNTMRTKHLFKFFFNVWISKKKKKQQNKASNLISFAKILPVIYIIMSLCFIFIKYKILNTHICVFLLHHIIFYMPEKTYF